MKKLVLAVALAATTLPAGAADAVDPRIASELEGALLRLAEAGALPKSEQPVEIARDPQLRYELGAVVDVRAASQRGLPILAITPDSAAARIGLQAGDRLLALNGVEFDSGRDNAGAFRTAIADHQGELQLKVERGADVIELQGRADARVVPGFRFELGGAGGTGGRGCGRVSVVLDPPQSQDIYPIALHEIDGGIGGTLSSEVFRLAAGRHVLKVGEAIDGHRFTAYENLKRGRLFHYERYKYFEIDVKPNTTYRLGARFLREHKRDIRAQKYWEPVVWSEVEEKCGG